jgi:hypothetical protein
MELTATIDPERTNSLDLRVELLAHCYKSVLVAALVEVASK